jgi:hypothetical protein
MVICSIGFLEVWQGVQGAENGPRRETPARGPTRPWRTLSWLFLAELLPSRARLRFTRQNQYTTDGGNGLPRNRKMRIV